MDTLQKNIIDSVPARLVLVLLLIAYMPAAARAQPPDEAKPSSTLKRVGVAGSIATGSLLLVNIGLLARGSDNQTVAGVGAGIGAFTTVVGVLLSSRASESVSKKTAIAATLLGVGGILVGVAVLIDSADQVSSSSAASFRIGFSF